MTATAADDQMVEGPESLGSSLTDAASDIAFRSAGSVHACAPAIYSATVTLSGTANVTEGGATSTQTVTLTLHTTGTGSAALATAISGITLAANDDYTARSEERRVGKESGARSSITATAADDQLVEGPESLGSSLTGAASNAAFNSTGSGTISGRHTDSNRDSSSDVCTANQGGATSTQTVTLTLHTTGTGSAALATAISGITLAANDDYTA